LLTRTSIEVDITAVRNLVLELEPLFQDDRLFVSSRPGASNPLHDGSGWLPPGVTEADFTEITPPFRGTVVEELLKQLPARWGRARLIRMPPKSCLSFHRDDTTRFHLAVKTNAACYLIERRDERGIFYHVPDDGFVYHADTRRVHSSMNSSNEPRIHLVVANLDEVGVGASSGKWEAHQSAEIALATV